METVFETIDKLAAELKTLLPMRPEYQQKLDKKFRLEFNYNSNHIEGNTLTYSETELLLIFDDTKGNHTMREYEEMKAHDVAFHLVEEWAKDQERPLTEQNIKNLNEIILVRPFWKDAITPDGQATRRLITIGNYKEQPNSVRLANGEMFHYTSPADTPIAMQELLAWYRDEENGLHPVTLAAMLHYKFVRIHPFDDGNGRIARLLMNYVLLRHDLPPLIIKSNDKKNYLAALHQADVGDYAPFIAYIAEQLLWSLDISIKAAKGETIDEPDDLDKELSVLQRELKGEDDFKISATPDNIYEAVEFNILPLFKLIEEKCQKLKEYFFEMNQRVGFADATEIKNTMNGPANLDHYYLMREVRNLSLQEKLKTLYYTYEMKGFSKDVSHKSFWINLEVNFNKHNYTIQSELNWNSPVVVPYKQRLSESELLEIISPSIKEMIEGIKRINDNDK